MIDSTGSTDSKNVCSEFLDIQTGDGTCDAYVSYPKKDGSFPGILFYMDGFGPRAYLYEMADRLASNGYFVLLPNFFYRVRRAPVVDVQFPVRMEDMAEVRKHLLPLVHGLTPEQAMADAGAFLSFLAQRKQARPGKIGITGYCMGGALALRTASRHPDRVAAAASFHGGNLVTDQPNSPHQLIGDIQAELYIAHADKDPFMTSEQIEKLRVSLEQAGTQYEAELYSGASHGFAMADLPAYNSEALERHWRKLLALFERTLQR